MGDLVADCVNGLPVRFRSFTGAPTQVFLNLRFVCRINRSIAHNGQQTQNVLQLVEQWC